jgi:hypothetical protein
MLPQVVPHPQLAHPLEAEILSVGSAKDMVTFLPSVQITRFYLSTNKVNGSLKVNLKVMEHKLNKRMNKEMRVLVIYRLTWEIALFHVVCLVLMQLEKRKGSDIIFFTLVAPSRTKCAELLLTMEAAIT